MINLPDRCYHLISRVACRTFEGGKRRIERGVPKQCSQVSKFGAIKRVR